MTSSISKRPFLAKPFNMTEGFLIGGGIILAGLMLQLGIGPVVWDAFRWPVNALVLVVFLALITTIFLLRIKVYAFRFLGTNKAAVPALAYTVVLTIIMGLTRQESNGTWLNNILSFWPFVLIYVYLTVILGQVVLQQISTFTRHPSFATLRPSLFLHLGLFLAMTAATLGNADIQRLKMMTTKGVPESYAIDRRNMIVHMPFTIELKNFIMETYPDGKPKRYVSDIIVSHRLPLVSTPLQVTSITIDVNKPAEVDGWKIYQYDYDSQMGTMSQISIFELVSDPWLPLVYTGIYLMLGGAVFMIVRAIPWKGGVRQARKHPKMALLLFVLVAVCFFCVHHFMPILHSDTLVPALQSPWFRPHIIAYMTAYTLMASAAVIALVLILRRRMPADTHPQATIVFIGLSLITIGMLFGALWAKEAWGHYWEWDPKETWAAITWFAYLIYIHYRKIPTHRPRLALWMLLISFVLLQMCWWGIKFLPSAQGASVHIYNM